MQQVSETCPVKQIVLLGHSYIRRLGEFMSMDESHGNLGLPLNQFNVTCIGLGGGTLRAGNKCMRKYVSQVLSLNPSIIYIHLGENDVNHLTSSRITVLLLELLYHLSVSCNLNCIIVSQNLPFPVFSEEQKSILIGVNRLCADSLKGMAHYRFWRHRGGFWHPKSGRTLYDIVGVHLNEDGMEHYWHSVQGAVKRALKE